MGTLLKSDCSLVEEKQEEEEEEEEETKEEEEERGGGSAAEARGVEGATQGTSARVGRGAEKGGGGSASQHSDHGVPTTPL